jgi:type I restriction-modification system DNA methylase subunit
MRRRVKREALTVTRLIHDVLVGQLNIPLHQIVNDTTFSEYTGSKRPDLLISEFAFDIEKNNEKQFIENLVAYAEAKDDCVVGDGYWKEAISQGEKKSKKLKLPYFIITNCRTTIFYNAKTGKEIKLNGHPIREFQTIDILRLIKNKLQKSPLTENIQTNVDSLSTISEAIFNKKLWELETIYRGINFGNNYQEKIDFTIGFISLKFFEEKEKLEVKKDNSKIYWSECDDDNEDVLVAKLSSYIKRLEKESDFTEFKELMEVVRKYIYGGTNKNALVEPIDVKQIYEIISSMGTLHGTGFDLFGAVYEMFASSKEKKEFGQYFTRRHYTHIFSKLLLKNEKAFNKNRKFKLLDLACGTGGFLTESFKVLKNNYEKSETFDKDAKKFLSKECFYGVDVIEENIQRTKLNMFLVGDGHTNMYFDNTLRPKFKWEEEKYDYIITNPPYGNGTIKANTDVVTSNRTEIAFLCKIIELLKIGGKACIIIPDGILENPTLKPLREWLLKRCDIDAIISLPKFAFAPYTKEKTYALFITKRSEKETKVQKKRIWFYIIDNDGLANSDKRFPTKLRNNRNGWMHDEISGWVSTEGEEMEGLLEERWINYDDLSSNGTKRIDEFGKEHKERKAGFEEVANITSDKFVTLLPEYYMRPYKSRYITKDELIESISNIKKEIKNIKL